MVPRQPRWSWPPLENVLAERLAWQNYSPGAALLWLPSALFMGAESQLGAVLGHHGICFSSQNLGRTASPLHPLCGCIMDATTIETTEPYPLGNRVIHANIQSIEPEESSDSRENAITSPNNVSEEEEKAMRKRSSEMQLWWDEAIARNMNLPDGYQNVAVLIIKWSKELDELKTAAEVS